MPIFTLLLAVASSAAAPHSGAPPTGSITSLALFPDAAASAIGVRIAITPADDQPRRHQVTLKVGDRRVTTSVMLRAAQGEGSATTLEMRLALPGAKQWSPEHPSVYQLAAILESGGRVVDRRLARFGLRAAAWEPPCLTLNGEKRILRGAALSPAAAADPAGGLAALEALRRAGFSLVQFPVSPAATGWLEWCDAHGMLAVSAAAGAAVAPGTRAHPSDVGEGSPAVFGLDAAVPGDQAADDTPPWVAEFDGLGLGREFGSATGFVAAARALHASRVRHAVEDERILRGSSPGTTMVIPAGGDTIWSAPAPIVRVFLNRPADPALAPDLPRLNAPWLLAIRPAGAVVQPDGAFSATVTGTGPGPCPRDAVLEWRVVSPGEDPALPPPWKAGLPAATNLFWSLPPVAVNMEGRWLVQVRLRRGGRDLAAAEEPFWCARTEPGSQISFAVLGRCPPLREAFRAWIIPADAASITVVSVATKRPHDAARREAAMQERFNRDRVLAAAELEARMAQIGLREELTATVMEAVLARVAAGGRVVFLPMGADDLEWLHGVRGFPPDLKMAPRRDPAHRFPVVRIDRFGAFQPGVNAREPWRSFAGGPVEAFARDWSPLTAPDTATVYAGSVDAGAVLRHAGASSLAWGATVMSVPFGKGSLVFCQWNLIGWSPGPLARLLFMRLLTL